MHSPEVLDDTPFKNRVLGWFEGMWSQIFGVAVFHQKSKLKKIENLKKLKGVSSKPSGECIVAPNLCFLS